MRKSHGLVAISCLDVHAARGRRCGCHVALRAGTCASLRLRGAGDARRAGDGVRADRAARVVPRARALPARAAPRQPRARGEPRRAGLREPRRGRAAGVPAVRGRAARRGRRDRDRRADARRVGIRAAAAAGAGSQRAAWPGCCNGPARGAPGRDARADRAPVPTGRRRARAATAGTRTSRATPRCSSPSRSRWSRSSSPRPGSRGGCASRPTRSSRSWSSGRRSARWRSSTTSSSPPPTAGSSVSATSSACSSTPCCSRRDPRDRPATGTGSQQNAVLEERRRIARDMHDGVAQELRTSIGARRSVRRAGDVTAREIAGRGRSGRSSDSRRAIAALTRPARPAVRLALPHEAVETVAAR